MKRSLLLTAVLLLLIGCGGGGGGAEAPTAQPVPPIDSGNALADNAGTSEDTPLDIDVLLNDTGINTGSLSVVSQPANGTALVTDDLVRYTPNPDFNGTDTFSYQVATELGNVRTASVTVVVTAINDLPIARMDQATVIVNTPTTVPVIDNDEDTDGNLSSIELVIAPSSGTAEATGVTVTYAPGPGFVGSDSFSYVVIDDSGGTSAPAQVNLEVVPITATSLSVASLPVPDSGYTTETIAGFGSINVSAPMAFNIPPNTRSFALYLTGDDVGEAQNQVLIAAIRNPTGTELNPFRRRVSFCDPAFCAALVPRVPPLPIMTGDWFLRLGARTNSLPAINFSTMSLHVAIRTGPAPETTLLTIKPFLTARPGLVSDEEFQLVLDRFRSIAAQNSISAIFDSTTRLTETRFTEVPLDFRHQDTAALVSMGAADRINLFFVEGFSGPGGAGLIGVSAGLPGSMGLRGPYNGTLINVLATKGGDREFFARTTAEIAFHEMGHFLGLYHTTEQRFDQHDYFVDTPACSTTDDADNDGTADPDECADGRNLMFWVNDFEAPKDPLSTQQRAAIAVTPVAVPE